MSQLTPIKKWITKIQVRRILQISHLFDSYNFIYYKIIKTSLEKKMIEPLLFGIVLGLIPVTLSGLFVAAYLQYKRGNQFGL